MRAVFLLFWFSALSMCRRTSKIVTESMYWSYTCDGIKNKHMGASRETIKRSIYTVIAISCQCMLQDNVYSLASGKITPG